MSGTAISGRVTRQHSPERFDFVLTEDLEEFLAPGRFVDVIVPGTNGDARICAIIEGGGGDIDRHQQQRHAFEYHCKVLTPGQKRSLVDAYVADADERSSVAPLFSLEPAKSQMRLGQLWGTSSQVAVNPQADNFKRHCCVFGSSGSGKTTLLFVAVEELLLKIADAQVIVLDPNSDFAKFDMPDGDPKNLSADQSTLAAMPKELIADPKIRQDRFQSVDQTKLQEIDPSTWVTAAKDSVEPILDTTRGLRFIQYNLGSMAFSKRATVAEAVLSALWERNEKSRRTTFVVIDEAHNLAPAVAEQPWQARTLDWVNRISGEGRKYGLFLILVSQRPAKIHSNTLDNCRNFMILRLDNRDDIEALARRTADVSENFLGRVATFRAYEALVYGDLGPGAIIRSNPARMKK